VSPDRGDKTGSPETMKDLGEFGFIEKIRSALRTRKASPGSGIVDDAAILKASPGMDLVLTTDMLVEGRHFDLKLITPWQLGAKSMAVNISDCAAMGAKPKAALISLGVPGSFPVADLESFYEGLNSWGGSYGVEIVGGDTVGSDKFVVNVALLGEVESGLALRRNAAKPGDALFVTGSLGDSAAGLHSILNPSPLGAETAPLLVKRHLTPVPRFTAGRFLVTQKCSSCAIDVSDGLSSEILHICAESSVGAEIHEEALPLSDALLHYCSQRALDPLSFALNGGEDYELLFTVPLAGISKVLQRLPGETGTACKSIGRIVPQAKGVTLISKNGSRRPLKAEGFDHFRKPGTGS